MSNIGDNIPVQRHLLKMLMLLFFLFIQKIALSQDLQTSLPSKSLGKYDDYEIVGSNDNGIWLHYSKNEDHLIELYNDNLRLIQKKSLLITDKKTYIDYFTPNEYGLNVFCTQLVNGKQYFKVKSLDNSLNFNGGEMVLDSINRTGLLDFEPYFLKTSNNNKYFVIFRVNEDNSSFYINFHVFDNNFNSISKSKFTIEESGNFVLKSFKISDQGVLAAVVAKEDDYKLNDAYNLDFLHILIYDSKSSFNKSFTINEEKYNYKSIVTEISNESNILYYASCYQKERDNFDLGLHCLSIDLVTGKKLIDKNLPFTKEMIEKTNSYDFKSWDEKAAIVRPRKIIPLSNRGMMLITEGEYTYTRVVRTNPYPSSYYMNDPTTHIYDQNHYFDIFAFTVMGDNAVQWHTVLPKTQISEGDNGMFSSFTLFEAKNLVKFIFNDDIYNNGNLVEFDLNPNGDILKKSLFSSEKLDLTPVPKKAKQLQENVILIPSERKTGLQLIKIKY
jgi:hypothetical protein